MIAAEEILVVPLTVRDFMPSWCMSNDSYTAAWNFEPPQFLPSPTFRLNQGIDPSDLLNGVNKRNCPYFEFIASGEVSGHAFMEDAHFSGGREGTMSLVGKTLEEGTSGLLKPVHCSFQNSCDPKLNPLRLEEFNSLFNDEKKFNKRSGFNLNLFYDESRKRFRYNSQNPSHEENDQFEGVVAEDLQTPYQNNPSVDDPSKSVPERFFGPLDRFIIPSSPFYFTEDEYPNPLEEYMEAWPQNIWHNVPDGTSYSVDKRVRRTKNHKFWFTSEFHTTFQYRGGEVFNFNVQDMAWVFIDGMLVTEIDGTTDAVQAFVNLDEISEEFGLKIGEIYLLDAFQIEKHTGGSTWLFESTLVEACNVVKSGTVEPRVSISGSSEGIKSFGVGFDETSAQILTKGTDFSTSFLFFEQQVNAGTGFVFEFEFSVDGTSDGGFAVVLHRREAGLKNIPISGASQMGFKNFDNSIAIVFDFCEDRIPLVCSIQNIRIHFGENAGSSGPGRLNGVNPETLRAHDGVMGKLSTGRKHKVSIQYLETPDHLNVFLDGSLYLRKTNFNVETIIGGRNAFIGFTAGHSMVTSNVSVSNLNLRTVDIDPAQTMLITKIDPANLPTFLADGNDFTDITLQTRDSCDNFIQNGGDQGRFNVDVLPDGAFVFADRRLQAAASYEIIDDGNGAYLVRLKSEKTGPFGIFVSHGDECLNFSSYVVASSDEANSTKCTYILIPEVAEALEPPPATAPPTVELPTSRNSSGSRSLLTAITLLIILFCVLMLIAALMTRFKKKWDNEKHLVPIGREELLDQAQNYGNNDLLTSLNRQHESVQRNILEEKARQNETEQQKKLVDNLRKENSLLGEVMKDKLLVTEVAVAKEENQAQHEALEDEFKMQSRTMRRKKLKKNDFNDF